MNPKNSSSLATSDLNHFDLARLAASGLIQRLEYHRSISSTNDAAAALAAEEHLACPALVLASEQTAGRGRGSNRWWSTPGSLMFSLVVQGNTTKSQATPWAGFSLTAGLAIGEALAWRYPTVDFSLKWPNDVYASEQKICGILIESPAQARGRMIVGVGVNVNNSFREAPEELQARATAVCDLAGQAVDLTDLLLSVLESLTQRWQQLSEQGFAALREEWQCRSLLTGRTVQLQAGSHVHIGRCQGIDEEGALVLQTEKGRQTFHAGSVLAFE